MKLTHCASVTSLMSRGVISVTSNYGGASIIDYQSDVSLVHLDIFIVNFRYNVNIIPDFTILRSAAAIASLILV